MNGKNVLGMIFANIHEEALDTLTNKRTMGSVPFCSRYRLIDFPLSNMVESSIAKVGVVTNANFNSLMDHVGTGKPWDLSRKTDGLYLLPPYAMNSVTMSSVAALAFVMPFFIFFVSFRRISERRLTSLSLSFSALFRTMSLMPLILSRK